MAVYWLQDCGTARLKPHLSNNQTQETEDVLTVCITRITSSKVGLGPGLQCLCMEQDILKEFGKSFYYYVKLGLNFLWTSFCFIFILSKVQ